MIRTFILVFMLLLGTFLAGTQYAVGNNINAMLFGFGAAVFFALLGDD